MYLETKDSICYFKKTPRYISEEGEQALMKEAMIESTSFARV